MSIAVSVDPRIKSALVTEDLITVDFVDGRTVSVPLAWSWRLSEATPEQRARFEIIGDGQGCTGPTWMRISVFKSMLTGIPARRPGRMDNVLEARNLDV